MGISVDSVELANDGLALTKTPSAPGAAACAAPGQDPVSAGVAHQLTTKAARLHTLLAHSGLIRSDGGVSLVNVADSFIETDNASATNFVDGRCDTPITHAPWVSPAVPPPVLPDIATFQAPPALPGEAFARALHDGPGAQSVRSLASSCRQWADDLDLLADETERTGQLVNRHWDDGGQQRAGANIVEHAGWVRTIGGEFRALATAADEFADHYQRTADGTPTPQQFEQSRRTLRQLHEDNIKALGALTSHVGAAAAHLANQHGQAVEYGAAYYDSSVISLAAIAPSSDAAPEIVSPTRGNLDDDLANRPPRSNRDAIEDQPIDRNQPDDAVGDKPKPDAADELHDNVGDTTALSPVPDSAATNFIIPQVPMQPTNSAGNLLGNALSTLGQTSQTGMPLNAAAPSSPLSALSGLTSLPNLGDNPSKSSIGDLLSSRQPTADDYRDLTDPGYESTHPASGVNTAGPPTSAVSALPQSVAGVPTATTPPGVSMATPSPTARPYSGMGMFPPMMGAPNRNEPEQRNEDLFPDKRVVHRPVANSEPVFGELERSRRSRPSHSEGKTDAR